ncbi:molecular chaperone HscC [Virgibacillus sp. FSP13]
MTVIGIDLGTSNSLVAYWTESGSVIIPNNLGEKLTPSVVGVDDNGELLVGAIAKERLITHPNLTASVFKREMGSDRMIRLGKYNFSPEELSSFVIKSLKADAEAYLKEEITEAVISVPAYFNDVQRKATKRAAEFAGLHVERLISEPTAAALAYGLHQQKEDTNFLIFDLGGGTYDVSILEFFEGVMDVRAIAGDNYLGGADFTDALVHYFIENQQLDTETLDEKDRSSLTKQAETCKRTIGMNQAGEIVLEKNGITYREQITRQQFEKIVHPLIIRLRVPIERALRDASLSPDELDAVVLVGGASRMPIIKTIVGKMMGRLPFSDIDPDETVAQGTAVQAALKERNVALKEMVLTDVCPYTLGIEVARRIGMDQIEAGHFSPIIERNTPIPVSRVEQFHTIHDNQTEILVEIFQGESRLTKNNLQLGDVKIDVPPSKSGEELVDVRFTYDINGILEVECASVSTGKMERIIIENSPGDMTSEEIEARLKALEEIKIHPRELAENRLLMARGERMYEEALGDHRKVITKLLEDFEAVLQTQDRKKVDEAASQLKEQLDQIERWQHVEW